MKHQEVMDKVQSFSEEMLLHYSSPNRDLIVEILQFDANGLADLHDSQLSKYILVLGQYLVMLQYNDNLKNIEKVLISKTFDFTLNKVKSTTDAPPFVKTEKEKRSWFLSNNEELMELETKLLVAEAEATLISGMTNSIEALLNALKKEKSSRGPGEH